MALGIGTFGRCLAMLNQHVLKGVGPNAIKISGVDPQIELRTQKVVHETAVKPVRYVVDPVCRADVAKMVGNAQTKMVQPH